MKRIYTRTGDKGMTGIHGGERVFKDDIRIEANGCIDELNAVIGIVRSFLPQEHEWQSLLFSIQKNMMAVMSHVATPSTIREGNPNILPDDLCSFCEEAMDTLMEQMEDNSSFILPGGTPVSAQLQFARTVARRAERRLWTLHKQDPLPEIILRFINRLSDLFLLWPVMRCNNRTGRKKSGSPLHIKERRKSDEKEFTPDYVGRNRQ